jgi:hypothetical protein
MRLKLSENPKEWRKAGVLSSLGFAVLSSLLRWRHHLRQPVWLGVLAVLVVVMVTAIWRPRWFRGWYRLAGWIAFLFGQAVGRVAFTLVFLLVITPAGLIMRLMNRDPLRRKRDPAASSYWNKSKESTPLDRMF